MDEIQFVEDKDPYWDLVNMVTNLQLQQKAENLFTRWAITRLSRMPMYYGVSWLYIIQHQMKD
jgi:hypothetical protein